MNAIQRRAQSVPLEKKIELIDIIYPEALSGNPAAFNNLFDIYNKYLAPIGEELEMTCDMCRAKVIMDFKMVINHWSE